MVVGRTRPIGQAWLTGPSAAGEGVSTLTSTAPFRREGGRVGS